MKPLVSLITPVYNAMPYLKDYLDSVIAQTWRPLQLILADDGSEDDSAAHLEVRMRELMDAGLDVKLLKMEHRSQAAAVNAALKEVRGDYLTWCDADDIMLPGCVEKKALFLLAHPELGMVRNDGLIIDGETVSPSTKADDRRTQDIFHELFLQTTYCYAGCYMIRMSLFDECYPDRNIPLSPEGQNLQLLLPPASRTLCGFVPETLHRYYKRTSGHSSGSRSYTERRRRILNFSALYKEILPFCSCDREYYENKIRDMENEMLANLNRSAVIKARESMRKK